MFLETVCVKNGMIQNEAYHRNRMKRTADEHGFSAPLFPDLVKLIPKKLKPLKVKCRMVYGETIRDISFTAYIPRQIGSLKLVEIDELDYSYKYEDRTSLTELLSHKGSCDDILIVQQGFVTDTSYSNVVFEKQGKFFTPDTYLLNGTKRQQLLADGIVSEMPISVDEIDEFDTLYLINAMLGVEDGVCLPTRNVIR